MRHARSLLASFLVLTGCTFTRNWDDLTAGPPPAGPGGGGAGGTGAGGAGGEGGEAGAGGVLPPLGGAMRFAGACASASDAASDAVDFGGGESFTVELWYQPEVFDQFNLPIHKGGSSLQYPGWDIEVTSDGGLTFYANDGVASSGPTLVQALVVGHAYHIAATREGANAELWLLDETAGDQTHRSIAVVTDMLVSWNNQEQLTIGGSSTAASNCVDYASADGIMDEVRIWGMVRTQIDLDVYYDEPVDCNTPNLLAYYRIDDNNLEILDDCTANNIDLNIVGGTAPTDYEWLPSPFAP